MRAQSLVETKQWKDRRMLFSLSRRKGVGVRERVCRNIAVVVVVVCGGCTRWKGGNEKIEKYEVQKACLTGGRVRWVQDRQIFRSIGEAAARWSERGARCPCHL